MALLSTSSASVKGMKCQRGGWPLAYGCVVLNGEDVDVEGQAR